MSEHLTQSTHESAPAAASLETPTEVLSATDAERAERAQLGQRTAEANEEARVDQLRDATQAVEALFAAQADKGGDDERRQEFGAEGLAGLHAEITKNGSGIADVYADANGAVWVVNETGQQKRYGDVAEAHAALGLANEKTGPQESDETSHDAQTPPEPDETVAFVETAIEHHERASQESETSSEAPATSGEAAAESGNEQTERDVEYNEETAYGDLVAFGLSGRAANLVLDVQHNFSKKERGAFLEPYVAENLFRRSELPEEKRQEFSRLLEQVHDGLTPPQNETAIAEQAEGALDENETKEESIDNPRLHRAATMVEQRVVESLKQGERIGDNAETQLTAVQDILRTEITKLERVSGAKLDIIAPYVEKALGEAREMLQMPRKSDEARERTFDSVRSLLNKVAHDEEFNDTVHRTAQQSIDELAIRRGAKREEAVTIALRLLDNIGTKSYDDRQDTVSRLKRLVVKLEEAKEADDDPVRNRKVQSLKTTTARLTRLAA